MKDFARDTWVKATRDFDAESSDEDEVDFGPQDCHIDEDDSSDEDSEFDVESDNDEDESARGRPPIRKPQALAPALPPRSTINSSSTVRSAKYSSLLPKDILNLPQPSMSQSPFDKVVLVNIYQVFQHCTKKGEEEEPRLLDNYGSKEDAEERIHQEIQRFRDSRIAVYSCCHQSDPKTDLLTAQIVHNEKNGTFTKLYIVPQTRLSDSLSGYDPELFKPILKPTVWSIVQHLTLKPDLAETSIPTYPADRTAALFGEPEAAHPMPPRFTFNILGLYTTVDMANNAACEAFIQITRPKSNKLDEHDHHKDLIRQLTEERDSHNRDNKPFEAELESDAESLPWMEYSLMKIWVEEKMLEGPLN